MVLVIIGITMSFALVAFGDFGEKRRIIVSAEQFMNYVTLIEQQAILESSAFRINLTPNSYQTARFQAPNQWKNRPENSVFHMRHVADHAFIRLDPSTGHVKNPSIFINATGGVSPFVLHIGTQKQADMATVIGNSNGTLVLRVEKSS